MNPDEFDGGIHGYGRGAIDIQHKTQEIIEKLESYIDRDGSKYSDDCTDLITIFNRSSWGEEFKKACIRELKTRLNWYETEWEEPEPELEESIDIDQFHEMIKEIHESALSNYDTSNFKEDQLQVIGYLTKQIQIFDDKFVEFAKINERNIRENPDSREEIEDNFSKFTEITESSKECIMSIRYHIASIYENYNYKQNL